MSSGAPEGLAVKSEVKKTVKLSRHTSKEVTNLSDAITFQYF